MTVRSVIDIDVNDDKFKEFLDSVKAYKDGIAEANLGWKAAEVASAAQLFAAVMLTEEFKKQEAARKREEAATKKATAEEKKRFDDAKKAVDKINQDVQKIGRGLLDATGSLLKWVDIGGLLAGLSGAGGLFGIDALGRSIAEQARSARRLGVTASEEQAANINYGQIIDTSSNLGNIAGAQADLAKQWAFTAMGVNQQGKDPAQLMVEMAEKAKDIWTRGPHTQQYADSTGLSTFYSLGDLRSLERSDLHRAHAGYTQDVGDFNRLGVGGQDAWTQFIVQMERASQTLKVDFGRALLPLAPALEKLSHSVIDVITELTAGNKGGKLGEWIRDLADGIKGFGDYLLKPEFQQNAAIFVADFDAVTAKIVSGLQLLGVIPDSKKDDPHTAMSPGGGIPGAAAGAAAGYIGGGVLGGMPGSIVGGVVGAGVGGFLWGGAERSRLVQFEHDYDLPKGSLMAIYGNESSYGRNKSLGHMTKHGWVDGPFQMLYDTAKQYGVKDQRSFMDESLGAAKYFRDLLRHFGGDIQKALAGYNEGQGNVDYQVKHYGAGWLGHAPAETQDYVKKGLIRITANVNVNNNTGGNANVTANQAAVQ